MSSVKRELFSVEGLEILDLPAISLTLDAGKITTLKGASGIGKTVLLRAIADLDPVKGGEVFLKGISREEIPAPQWRYRVAYLPATSHWWSEVVFEHFPPGSSESDYQPFYESLVLRSGIEQEAVAHLSSGELQRLALIRTLLREPEILLLDEPTAHLDSATVRAAEQVIATYCTTHGAAALWVSHDAEQAGRIAEQSLLIDREKGVFNES